MRCNRLTKTSKRYPTGRGRWRLVTEYEWHGAIVEVCDSARNILLLIELFADEEASEVQKDALLRRMLFFDPDAAFAACGGDMQALVCDVMWDVCGLDVTPNHVHSDESEPSVFDWDEDAARIRASLLSAYGIDWDASADSITYANLCDLLGALLESRSDTPFQQAVYYRTAEPPKRNRDNGDYVDQWLDAREYFELKGEQAQYDAIEAQQMQAASMFAAAERAASHG